MSKFDAIDDVLTDRIADAFGDAATFTAPGGDPISTKAIFNSSTVVMSDLGPVQDDRPSIDLVMADVGQPKAGVVVITEGKNPGTYRLDRMIKQDGSMASYFVRPESGS